MRILLVYPSTGENIYSLEMRKIIRRVPFTFAQLIASTPGYHDIQVVDERYGDKVDFNEKYDLVAITSLTIYAIRGYEIADEFRKKGIGPFHSKSLDQCMREFRKGLNDGYKLLFFNKFSKKILNVYENF